MMVLATTKVYKNFQTSIPKELRESFDVTQDTIVEWGINDNGEPVVNFRKKVVLEDIIGLVKVDEITDSTKLKKEVYEQ